MKHLRLSSMDIAASLSLMVYAASAVATPICLLVLSRELGLNLTQGGGIEATRAVLLVGVLLASGTAASRWGKTAVLHVGGFTLAAGLVCFGLAPSYAAVLLAMVAVGLGGGILEALLNPLVQDLHPHDSGKYLNLTNAFWPIGLLTTVLVAGEVLTFGGGWRSIFFGIAAISFIVALFFLRSSFRAHRQGHIPPSADGNPLHHARDLLRERHFWLFAVAMVCGGGVEGAYTFWSASYIQIYHEALPRAGAIGVAIFAAGMIVTRFGFGSLIRQDQLHAQILVSAAASLCVCLGFFWVSSLTGLYILLFFAGLSCACFWPSIQSYAVDRLQGESTMIFILLSAMGIPGFAGVTWLMGLIGDLAGLRIAFAVVPVLMVILAISILIDRRWGPVEKISSEGHAAALPDPL